MDYSKSEVLIFPFREQLAPVMKQSNYEPLASKLKKQIQVPTLRDDQSFFIFDSNGMSLEEQKTFFEKG